MPEEWSLGFGIVSNKKSGRKPAAARNIFVLTVSIGVKCVAAVCY